MILITEGKWRRKGSTFIKISPRPRHKRQTRQQPPLTPGNSAPTRRDETKKQRGPGGCSRRQSGKRGMCRVMRRGPGSKQRGRRRCRRRCGASGSSCSGRRRRWWRRRCRGRWCWRGNCRRSWWGSDPWGCSFYRPPRSLGSPSPDSVGKETLPIQSIY